MWLFLLVIAVLSGCQRPGKPLPSLPDFQGQNRASVSAFLDKDARARRSPASAEAIGELGMLYHSYQFLVEASLCYEIARELDPDEYRFVYYGAKAEKAAFRYEASESLFQRGLEMRPDDAELWAELGELYLMWGRRGDAERTLARALELDPREPVASLGRARLLSLDQKWDSVIETLTPILELHPRLSKAHQYVAAAYGALGMETERARHQEAGEYGSAVESPLVRELHELALPAILDGDPARGPELLQIKCARCHNHERIYDHDEDRLWWARTVRRMQREAGWAWLTDDEAAAVVAYLAGRK